MSEINHLNLNSHWQSFFGEILYRILLQQAVGYLGCVVEIQMFLYATSHQVENASFFILFILAVFLQITVLITVVIERVWLFEFLMLVALAISPLLMPAALTILD